MNVQSERLSKVSKCLALSCRQFVTATKFCKGSGVLKVGLDFFAYDGCVHNAGSHAPGELIEESFANASDADTSSNSP